MSEFQQTGLAVMGLFALMVLVTWAILRDIDRFKALAVAWRHQALGEIDDLSLRLTDAERRLNIIGDSHVFKITPPLPLEPSAQDWMEEAK